jgi:hypothetical protein
MADINTGLQELEVVKQAFKSNISETGVSTSAVEFRDMPNLIKQLEKKYPTQKKTASPSRYSQTISADSGYRLSQVEVKPVTSAIDSNIIPDNIKKGVSILGVQGALEEEQIDLQAKFVEPKKTAQTILPDSNYDALSRVEVGAVTSAVDKNIQPGYIKKGVDILGVVGTLEGTMSGRLQEKTVTPTTSVQNIIADAGYDALSRVSVQAVVPSKYYKPEQSASVTPKTTSQTITPSDNYVFNRVDVSAVTSAIDPNIKAENIKKGVSILGVTGNMQEVGGSPKFAEILNGRITTLEESDLQDVTYIGQYVFYKKNNLTSVSIPKNIVYIGYHAFSECPKLTNVSLSEGLTEIDMSAFSKTAITEIVLPNGLKTIGRAAFYETPLTKITIPSSVTKIDAFVFYGCTQLTEVYMESITPPSVGSDTFPTTTTIYVPYGAYDDYVAKWGAYASQIVRLPAIPSTITVIVNDYTGALVSGASVTISGNGQTYTGTTDGVGTFTQGDLQPATYTISVADMEGFKTPASSEVVVEEDTQNSVTVTYLEKPAFSTVFGENSPETIQEIGNEISAKNMTSAEVESTYGWKIGDTTSYTLTTGEKVEMRIIGFCHDDLSDGSGKAGITLEMTHCLATTYRMNDTNTNAGGYPATLMRNTTLPTIKSTLPQEWQNVIKLVNKKSANGGGTNYSTTLTTSNELFLLAGIEVFGRAYDYGYAQDGANEGSQYEYWNGKADADRIKKYDKNADGVPDAATLYWLRSSSSADDKQVCMIYTNGVATYGSADSWHAISFAFCIGSAADYVPSTPEEPSGGSKVYGVEWVNDASTTMTRTDDAVGMTYTSQQVGTSHYAYKSDFDQVFPYNQMKRQVIDGNTFVYVPEMWFRVTADSNQKITSVAVSSAKGAGDNWYKTKPFYYGAYKASSDGAVLKSVSGVNAQYSITRATARTRAMAVGTGYHQRDLYASTILMFLWWIEFATKDSQSIMKGYSGCNKKTGFCDKFYNETEGDDFCVTGRNYSSGYMVWHGIDDFFGNGYEWVDGITGVSGGTSLYVSSDYTIYDDNGADSQMSELSYPLPTVDPTYYGNVAAIGWDNTKPFLCAPIEAHIDTSSSRPNNYFTDTVSPNNAVLQQSAAYTDSQSLGVSYFQFKTASTKDYLNSCRLMKEV